jgi:hypothetical protein
MNPAFRFARGGKVYKELQADEAHQIAGFILKGDIAGDDDYWMPGMVEWQKVSSRQWDFPAPTDEVSGSKPIPTKSAPVPRTATAAADVAKAQAAADAAQAQAAATVPSASAGRGHACECTACKKGFNEPAEAVSGYSVIGKAVKFFLFSIALQFVLGVLAVMFDSFRYGNDSLRSPGIVVGIILGLVVFVLAVLALGLLLMAVFELIAAAVTHGIYRSSPERCPYCKSPTFVKKW